MGAVVIQRIVPNPRANLKQTTNVVPFQNAVTLVDSLGCRVTAMKNICPEQPRLSTPLITTMPFRAFMFQGSQSGDEMVLSVRMLGCLNYEDCYQVGCMIFN